MLHLPDFPPTETWFHQFLLRSLITAHSALLFLTNLESLNSVLIRQGLPQPDRLATLNDIAITQMRTLLAANSVKRLK
jgi:hypothetical protein